MATSLRVLLTAAVATATTLTVFYLLEPQTIWVLIGIIGPSYTWVPTWLLIALLPAVFIVPTVSLAAVLVYFVWRKR
jgi:hypothetical protein